MGYVDPACWPFQNPRHTDLWAIGLTLALLLLGIQFGLTGAILGGLITYSGTRALASLRLGTSRWGHTGGLIAFTGIFCGILIALGVALSSFITGESVAALIRQISVALVDVRNALPAWIGGSLPSDPKQAEAWMGEIISSNSVVLQSASKEALHGAGRALIGMVVGGMIAVSQDAHPERPYAPVVDSLVARWTGLANAFGDVVAAQGRIALLNAFLTGLFLLGILPLMGYSMPFGKTLTIITLITGFIPVLGNLISNTAITLAGIGDSTTLGVICLAYLIVIHKLEYFLNARIVGGRMRLKSWEILAAMLVMEAFFGIAGVVMAPILYGWLKTEGQRMKIFPAPAGRSGDPETDQV